MLRLSLGLRFATKATKVHKPPAAGYEITELPNEKVFAQFLAHHKDRMVIAMIHSGVTKSIQEDGITRSFVSATNVVNLGHPDDVKMALIPGPKAPKMVDDYNVLTFPTCLVFYKGKVEQRVVGARVRELSIKTLFTLRNAGMNVISRR